MLVLAQEITVNVPPDPVGRIVSVAAVVLALASLVYTAWQGQALRRLETTQHEWEQVDRISAAIEVTSHVHRQTYLNDDRVTRSRTNWLRLRNSGRAIARDVRWGGEIDDLGNRNSLEELYPGEHYDIYLALTLADAPGWLFKVEWADDRGRHSTPRRISL